MFGFINFYASSWFVFRNYCFRSVVGDACLHSVRLQDFPMSTILSELLPLPELCRVISVLIISFTFICFRFFMLQVNVGILCDVL